MTEEQGEFVKETREYLRRETMLRVGNHAREKKLLRIIDDLQSQLTARDERDAEIVNLVQEYRDAKDVCDSELAEPPCDEHYSNHMAALNKRDSAATDFAEGVLYLFPPEAI